ncbi:hypothetical protein ANI_1_2516074 [Paecilomyces variotii No. 5]|uniref:BTB domain-containing protein n=1 Tax=Byssochlamys spectabilis (strain No. 5 / NBRC 109023) TaxID=1356009 RepID=V5I3Z1_BYSSN|nr:hypothetical protein ANI_1_2516074 [Paecilomyces variotii No. 5]
MSNSPSDSGSSQTSAESEESNKRTLRYIDFLHSDVVQVTTEDSKIPFKAHKDLLGSTSEALATDLDSGFGKVYTFPGTSITTLARFIEWAYTDTYPEAIDLPSDNNDNNDETDTESPVPDAEALKQRLEAVQAAETDQVLAHINLYIFAERHEIPRLKQAAFLRLRSQCANIGTPETDRTWPDVVDIIDRALSVLPADDELLAWLARYAAYRVNELWREDEFLDILQKFPDFSLEVIRRMRPAQSPAWPCYPVPTLARPLYETGESPAWSPRV